MFSWPFALRRVLWCVVAVCLVLAGCSTRSGPIRRRPLRPPALTTPAPTTPRSAPTTPTPTREPGCIPLHDGDCVQPAEFEARATGLAPQYRDHPNFQTQWGLADIRADLAYAHLNLLEGPHVAPGAGVTIGLIDTGIDQEHPVFAGKTIHEEFLMGAFDEIGFEFSHGTAVASVAAGGRIGGSEAPHGVAWGADLAVFAIPLGSSDGFHRPITLSQLAQSDDAWSELFGDVFGWRDGARRVDILNLSIGAQGIIDGYAEADLRANFGRTIAVLAQADAAEKTILVWAAGNSNGNRCLFGGDNCGDGGFNAVSVSVFPGLAYRIEELRGHSIAVVALKADGAGIADFSNRCGIAAEICIAAPGEDVTSAFFGSEGLFDFGQRGYRDFSGTSLATPMVSGGLAVMKQLFRDQLSNQELVTRLFRTADRTGIYADRDVYGNGRMDLGAATSPVGVLQVPLATGTLTAAYASLGGTGMRLGMAFGDGLEAALADHEVMALDDFGAPFWYGLGDFAATTDGPSMAARLGAFLGPASASDWPGAGARTGPAAAGPRVDVLRSSSASGDGHLALAEGALMVTAFERGGLSATAFTTGRLRPRMPAGGAVLRWRPGALPFGFRAGWVEERETMLGSSGRGAFGILSAGTAFAGFDGALDLGRWRLGANGELGVARPAAQGGILHSISPLATSAFALHADTALAGSSALRISLSQPLRVESGWASLTVPTGRTKRGEVFHRPLRANLAPRERQWDVAARWERPLPLGELRLGAVWSLWPGHRDVLGPDLAVLSGWRWTF